MCDMLRERGLKLQGILQKIHTSTVIQKYMEDICSDLNELLVNFSLSNTYELCNTQTGDFDVMNSVILLKPDLRLFNIMYTYVLTLGNKHKNKKNRNQYQHEIISRGNIREKCILFCNIMTNDPKFTIINWLLSRKSTPIPAYINCINLDSLRNDIGINTAIKPKFRVSIFDNNITLRPNCNSNFNFQQFMAPHSYRTRQSVRTLRNANTKIKYRLHYRDVIPELSCREHANLKTPIDQDGYIDWETGYMKWEIRRNCFFMRQAQKYGRDVIAGISGHAEYLYKSMSFFNSYDVNLTTLIVCLWLVSCEHHSLHEVLTTASFYGIPYDITIDPVDFLCELYEKSTKAS
jgi:hypothetical protein